MTDPDDIDFTDDEDAAVPLDLIADIAYSWWQWQRATHPLERAQPLIDLSNRLSDLRSYHPRWDIETGTMPWEREEDDG